MAQEQRFTVWIDNDACPRRVREIIFKASLRLGFRIKIVANSYMHPPAVPNVEVICTSSDFDAADDFIAENVILGRSSSLGETRAYLTGA